MAEAVQRNARIEHVRAAEALRVGAQASVPPLDLCTQSQRGGRSEREREGEREREREGERGREREERNLGGKRLGVDRLVKLADRVEAAKEHAGNRRCSSLPRVERLHHTRIRAGDRIHGHLGANNTVRHYYVR